MHENGLRKDNRKENLRWLCPNCHTQTSTFGGKRRIHNIRKVIKGIPIMEKRKVDHVKVLNMFNENKNYSLTGRSFGISDNAVRKIVKRTYSSVGRAT